MDRLTFKLGEQNPSYGLEDEASAKPGLFTEYDGFYAHLLAIRKLGQYEDTGLTPSQVQRLAKLQNEGRLHIAPCSDGTEIWCVVDDDTAWAEDIEGNVLSDTYAYGFTEYVHGELDKYWFLSKEAAEKALEESEAK